MNRPSHTEIICECTCFVWVYMHVHHELSLASRLALCQFMCVQCGRSKRKSFWNDGKKAVKVLQEYPIGIWSNTNEERFSLLSCIQDKQQVSYQMSTPDTPPLDMWAAHLGAPSLLASSPSNPSLHKQTSLLVSPSAITTIPCNSFCRLSRPRYSVMTTAASFGMDTVRDYVINSFLLRFPRVWFIHSLVCPWMPSLIIVILYIVLVKNTFSLSIVFQICHIIYSVEKVNAESFN